MNKLIDMLKGPDDVFSNEKASSIIITTGVVSGVFFILAGIMIGIYGSDLTELRSRGGQTIAEVYYQSMGKYGLSYSMMSIGAGLGMIMISLGFGSLLLRNKT